MPAKPSYRERLKQDLGEVIEALDLPELQRHFLRSRWLDQVLWMEAAADRSRILYYALRLATIAGGVIVPALVSLNVSGDVAMTVRWLVKTMACYAASVGAARDLPRLEAFGTAFRASLCAPDSDLEWVRAHTPAGRHAVLVPGSCTEYGAQPQWEWQSEKPRAQVCAAAPWKVQRVHLQPRPSFELFLDLLCP